MASYEASKYYGKDWDHWNQEDAAFTRDRVQCILLQEIRDELKVLNRVVACRNFQRMPLDLKALGIEARAKRAARLARQRKAREAK